QFSAEYKLRILREADACGSPGETGALLRREGLYSSHLTTWRLQRAAGQLAGLSPRPRGRKAQRHDLLETECEKLRREDRRRQAELEQAKIIIDVQKKVSEILRTPVSDERSS